MEPLTGQPPIETKLHPPNLTQSNVTREAILAGLAERAGVSAYVIAGAGFGKTTVLRQIYTALKGSGTQVVWLSLDARDDKATTFLSYMCEALIRAKVIDRHMLSGQTNFTSADGVDLAFTLLNEVAARVTQPTALFLDDVQALRTPRILQYLSAFLDAKSPALQVFLASRKMPALHLQRREMDGTFFRIGDETLRFDEAEAAAFFERSGRAAVEGADIARLVKSTEGWPAGIQIALLSTQAMQGRAPGIPAEFSGGSKQVVQYLSENVFQTLPEDVQDFLLATGQLPRFCADLCRDIREKDGNAAVLDWLSKNNLFLVALDNTGTWFRYHHLFADFLALMARRKGGYSRDLIFQRASAWCRENDLLDEAVNYLLDAENYAEATDLIAELAPRIARQKGDTVTMIRWIESIPPADRMRYPAMMLDYAFALTFSLQTDAARAIVEDIREVIGEGQSGGADAGTLAFADTVEALSYAACDDTDKALTLIAAARRRWTQADAGTLGIMGNIAAYCLMVEHRMREASREVVDARMHGLRAGLSYVSVWAECLEAMILCRSGELAGTDEPLARASRDAVEEGDSDLLLALVQLLVADQAYLRGNITQERLAAETGRSATFGPVEPLLISFRIRAWSAYLSGDNQQADEVIESGIALGLREGLPRLAFNLIGQALAFLALARDAGAARRLAEKWGVLGPNWKTRFASESPDMGLTQKRMIAELALVEGRFRRAAQHLHLLERRMKTMSSGADQIRIRILKAHALAQDGRTEDALRDLGRTAREGVDTGIIAPFIEYQAYVLPLLRETMRRRREADISPEVLAASPEVGLLARLDPKANLFLSSEKEAEDILPEPLTERERELLLLAGSGMTNAQIAVHAVISVATVKWHLHNAFQKLGVRNRTSALEMARKLDLI